MNFIHPWSMVKEIEKNTKELEQSVLDESKEMDYKVLEQECQEPMVMESEVLAEKKHIKLVKSKILSGSNEFQDRQKFVIRGGGWEHLAYYAGGLKGGAPMPRRKKMLSEDKPCNFCLTAGHHCGQCGLQRCRQWHLQDVDEGSDFICSICCSTAKGILGMGTVRPPTKEEIATAEKPGISSLMKCVPGSKFAREKRTPDREKARELPKTRAKKRTLKEMEILDLLDSPVRGLKGGAPGLRWDKVLSDDLIEEEVISSPCSTSQVKEKDPSLASFQQIPVR